MSIKFKYNSKKVTVNTATNTIRLLGDVFNNTCYIGDFMRNGNNHYIKIKVAKCQRFFGVGLADQNENVNGVVTGTAKYSYWSDGRANCKTGDVVEFIYNRNAGKLSIKINGGRLQILHQNIEQKPYIWAVSLNRSKNDCIKILSIICIRI